MTLSARGTNSDELAATFEAIAGNAAEAAGAAAIAAVPPADVAALARAISVDECAQINEKTY